MKTMNETRRIHRQKVMSRVRTLKAQARGRRRPKTFCLANYVDRAVLQAPLAHILLCSGVDFGLMGAALG